MLIRTVTVASIALVVMVALQHWSSGAPGEVDITGSYSCKGRSSRGETYQADVFISKNKNAYKIHWLLLGGAEYNGVGVRQGDYLAVAYSSDAENVGVVLYHVASKSTLIGTWTTEDGEGRVATEMLTRD